MRPITQLLISIAIIAVVVIATFFLFNYPQKLGPIFITALVVTLASFLLLLILRHFILIWFSYLHQRELAQDEPPDVYPFVSIIVPAFNEAEVIQSSLSSLLELRYPYYEIIAVDDGSTDGTFEQDAGVRRQPLRRAASRSSAKRTAARPTRSITASAARRRRSWSAWTAIRV